MMKTRYRQTKLIALMIAMSIIVVTWAILGASRAEAVIAIISQTGNFSLAHGQATSAYVVNTWAGDERGILVSWRALDSAGNVLAQSDRRRIEPGHASSFELGPVDLAEGQRMALRVELMVEGASNNHNNPGFIATQEVYNVGDGKTTVFLPYIEQ